MSKPRKLSEKGLKAIQERAAAKHLDYPHSRAVSDVDILLDHIAAMEAETRGWGSRAAKDAFEAGHANATFIEQQTQRIQLLEGLLKRTLQPLGDAEYDETSSALITEIEQVLGMEES